MNSITLVKNLIEKKNQSELDNYLRSVWNHVWTDNSESSYINLRLFKVADKIKTISQMGVDFRQKHILDIGCGNGTALMYLRKYFDIVGVGIDVSNSVIYELKNTVNDSKLSFSIGDHRDLSMLESNCFDVVLSFGVIEHFEEYCLALCEARRVLKTGGILVLIQPHLFSFGVFQEYLLRIIKKWRFGKQKDLSVYGYAAILKQTGFKNIHYITKVPYKDMKITSRLDAIVKSIIPMWGHYLYLIAEK